MSIQVVYQECHSAQVAMFVMAVLSPLDWFHRVLFPLHFSQVVWLKAFSLEWWISYTEWFLLFHSASFNWSWFVLEQGYYCVLLQSLAIQNKCFISQIFNLKICMWFLFLVDFCKKLINWGKYTDVELLYFV